MPRIPKVVGVRQSTKDGLWTDVALKLQGRLNDPCTDRILRARRRGGRHVSAASRLRAAFREEDET